MPIKTSNSAISHFEKLFHKSESKGILSRVFGKSELIPPVCPMCGINVDKINQRVDHRNNCKKQHIIQFSRCLLISKNHELTALNSDKTELIELLRKESIKLDKRSEHDRRQWESKYGTSLAHCLNVNLTRFEFIRPLTKGGYGQIFLTKDKFTQKIMATKIISISEAIQRHCIRSYVSEREYLLKCNSDHVVSLYYSFRSEFFIYQMMEYVEGGDLSSNLEISGRFSEETVRLILAQLLLALKELKKHRIVHGDIKLENILYSFEDGRIKLADFGLAFVENNPRKTAHGTPEYMAPEQILESKVGFESDMWAIGICTYEMLFGIPPFYDETADKILQKITHHKPIIWEGAAISDQMKIFITKLLDYDPSNRMCLEDAMQDEFFVSIDWKNRSPSAILPEYKQIFEARNKRYPSLQYYNITTIGTETVAFEDGVFNQNTCVENQINLLKLFPIKNLNKIIQ